MAARLAVSSAVFAYRCRLGKAGQQLAFRKSLAI